MIPIKLPEHVAGIKGTVQAVLEPLLLQLPLGRSLSPSAAFISCEGHGGTQEIEFWGLWCGVQGLCSLNTPAHCSPDMPLPSCIPCLVHCLLPWMWLDGCFSAGLTLKKNPCSQTEPRWAPLVFCERLRNLQVWKAKASCHPTWWSIALHYEWVFPCVPHGVAGCTSQHQLIRGAVLHLYWDAGFTCPFPLLSNKINPTRL